MTDSAATSNPSPSSRTGWLMVGCVFVILAAINGLTFYSMSAYIDALTTERGFGITMASSGPTVSSIAGGLSGLLVAALMARRVPIRLLLVVGALGVAAGLVAIGSVRTPWQLWLAFAVFGASSAATSAVPCSALVARWFPTSPGRPLAIAMTGLSAGGAFIPPIALALISNKGIASASRIIAVSVVAIILVVAIIVREAPAPATPAPVADLMVPDGVVPAAPRARVGDRLFWLMCVGFGLMMLSQLGTATHLVRLAHKDGIEAVGLAVSVLAMGSFLGRLTAIPVLASLGLRRFTALLGALQVLSLIVLATAGSELTLVVGAGMLGATVGNVIFLISLYCIEAYGLAEYPRMFARVNLAGPIGSGLGPLVIGFLVVLMGSYRGPILLMAAVSAVGASCLVGTGVDSTRRRDRDAAPRRGVISLAK